MILGAHVSVQGGIENGPVNADKLGIKAIQVFTKNQRQWNAKPLKEEGVNKWFDGIKQYGITHMVSHASYLVNLCAPNPENREKSLNSMVDELERAETLGISNVVVHPGSHLKEGEEWGIKTIAESIDEIHKRCPGFKTRITLENTAGMGSSLGHSFAQLGAMIKQTGEQERLAVCIDTCHAYAAGYDLTTKNSYEKVWDEFEKEIGFGYLHVFHLNDSKTQLGSRVDRHEKIGDGFIGKEAFRMLLHDNRFREIPSLLETPDTNGGYEVDLATLNSLRG